jgi:hypothetical protein
MNITCIHLRVNGSHIYIYSRKRIYKELLEKYNNKKANTYLIPTCGGLLESTRRKSDV